MCEYIENIFISLKCNSKHQAEELELSLNKLKESDLKYNIGKYFFGQTKMEYLGFLIMHNYVSPPKKRSVHTLYHLLYADYFLKQLVYICYLFLQDVDTFPPLPFVFTLYPVLSPSVSTLDSILYPPVSMLY